MNNEMRERFYQEIKNAFIKIGEGKFSAGKAIELADALIEAGLIFNSETDVRMIKFKYADAVYGISGNDIVYGMFVGYISDGEGAILSDGIIHPIKVAKIFYTEAEAQAALEERK